MESDDIEIDMAMAQNCAEQFLQTIMPGEPWHDEEDLHKTPERFMKMLIELTTQEEFNFTTFPNKSRVEGSSEMVTIKDIPFISLCKHHIAPFIGHAHIGYIPGERIAGLSKFARSVKWWARGLWTQEDLTHAIAGYLDDELDPSGLIVMLEAEHMCMTIRGVQSPGTKTTTTQLRGLFLDPPQGRDPKAEFLTYVSR